MAVRIIVLTLMAVFYGCYFGKLIRQKKQGIDTDQLGKGKIGFVKFIETALKAISWLLPAVQIVSIALYCNTLPLWVEAAGICITALGVSAFVMSVIQMKDNWRAGVQKEDKTQLVTDGIYRISRNPAFLGFDLMYIGILVLFFTPWLCAATAAALILFHLQIVNVEEDFLQEAFGEEYLQYKKKVCRYLGRKKW